jgi:hypothetical protein
VLIRYAPQIVSFRTTADTPLRQAPPTSGPNLSEKSARKARSVRTLGAIKHQPDLQVSLAGKQHSGHRTSSLIRSLYFDLRLYLVYNRSLQRSSHDGVVRDIHRRLLLPFLCRCQRSDSYNVTSQCHQSRDHIHRSSLLLPIPRK